MFSNSNKGRRRSFFLWGGGTNYLSNHSTVPSTTNASHNSKITSASLKSSPMKSRQDKNPISKKASSILPDGPVTENSTFSAEPPPRAAHNVSKNRSSASSRKHKVPSPQDGPSSFPTPGSKHKHSSSHISSHDKRKSSSSHKHTSSARATSSGKHKSSSSPQKEITLPKDTIAQDSAQDVAQGNPGALKERKLSRTRRPPPPVDLSVLKSLMKSVPEETLEAPENSNKGEGSATVLDNVEIEQLLLVSKQRKEEESVAALNYVERASPLCIAEEESVAALNYMERELPLSTAEDNKEVESITALDYVKRQPRPSTPGKKREEGGFTSLNYVGRGQPTLIPDNNREEESITELDYVQRDGEGRERGGAEGVLNPRQHRRQRSEAEKLVDDLDDLIKEHSEIHDSPTSAGGEIEGELSREIRLQNVLDTALVDPLDFNSDDALDSPLTFVGPLKLPLVSAPPTRAPPAPPSLPAAIPVAVPGVEELVFSKRKSGASITGDEQNDRFSFTDSLSDQSVKSVQQVALSETRGAAPIVSNLSCHNSAGFSAYANEVLNLNENSLDMPSLLNKGSLVAIDREIVEVPTNPFLPVSQFADIDSNVHTKTTDSDDVSSKVFDENSRAESADTEEPTPRRKFRVVNEDRPTFYMNSLEESLQFPRGSKGTDCYDGNVTHYSSRSHESSLNKGFSIAGGEKSAINCNSQSTESVSPSTDMRSAFPSLDSVSENEVPKGVSSSSKAKDSFIPSAQVSISTHQSVRSNKSNNSSTTISSSSPKPDKTVRLVSSYVEELRLKYDRTSNFLQAPPNLPVTLKQKNNLVQQKSIKVKIRTSSKQIGIKHGRAKQKLLTLETTEEDSNPNGSIKILSNKNKINVDHTKEFHNLLNNRGSPDKKTNQEESPKPKNEEEEFLDDIPGDDAYDSDDAMAPLREKRISTGDSVTRNSTIKSYYTKQQEKLQTISDSAQWNQLPTNINIQDYLDKESKGRKKSTNSGDSGLEVAYSYGQGLRVANPDSASD